jgi:hypothetical protein
VGWDEYGRKLKATSKTGWVQESNSTLLYLQLDEKLFRRRDDNFTVRVAHNVGEAVTLV